MVTDWWVMTAEIMISVNIVVCISKMNISHWEALGASIRPESQTGQIPELTELVLWPSDVSTSSGDQSERI